MQDRERLRDVRAEVALSLRARIADKRTGLLSSRGARGLRSPLAPREESDGLSCGYAARCLGTKGLLSSRGARGLLMR